MNWREKIVESVDYIKKLACHSAETAIVLGSGLGDFGGIIHDATYVPYNEIPHFSATTIEGHEGNMILGRAANQNIIVMQGRTHYYEGYPMQKIVYYLYVLKELGVKNVILSNAAGAINTNLNPGDLMFISDYINVLGINPLIGSNDEYFGPRFPDMTYPFSENLNKAARISAEKINMPYKEGVYLFMAGPCFETKAEMRWYQQMGADAIGMSTVPEIIVADYLGMNVLAISCITNMATGVQSQELNHSDVLLTAKTASEKFCELLLQLLKELDRESICQYL